MQGSMLQNRCSVQVLCMVSIQLAATTIINIEGSTGSIVNETHSNVHHLNSLVKSDPSIIKSYPNHRMDEGDTSSNIKPMMLSNNNNSFSHADREAASSILRPQLALQIYTNPPPQDSAIKSSSVFPRSFGPTMLIVPVQQKVSEDFHLTSSTNQLRHPHHQSSKTNQGKINQWGYLTYQGNNLLDGSSANGLSEYHPSSGPLINTIITVPTSGEQQTSNHRNQLSQTPPSSSQGSLQEDESKTSVDEQSIAKLLESQLAGNLEFTMTLNGEEITFNPATNKARITKIKSKGDSMDSTDDEGLLSIKRSSGRSSRDNGRIGSRTLKNHVDPDFVGHQQSASDIDITDSVNEEDETDEEYDRFSPNTARQEEKIIKPRTSDDNEGFDRDEKATGNGQNRHWPMDMGDDTDDQENRYVDDHGINESSSENQLTKAKRNKDSSQIDSSGKKGKSKVTKTGGRKSSSSYQTARKAQGSRKKVIHKNNDQNNEGKSDDKDDVPSVIIKSDDVRRFEQLLENLRSISMNTHLGKNRRSGEKSSAKQKQAPSDIEDDGRDDDIETGIDMKSESRQGSKQGDNSDTTDCDRKRQQQHQKVGTDDDGNSSYDLDSSPNTMDQEPANEADVDRDNQETDGQNGEQEEQTRHHPQKVAAPQISSSESNGDKQHEQRSSLTGKDKPKSVVLRNAEVQSYYNNDGHQLASQRDNIRSSHNTYDSTNEKNISKLDQLLPLHRPSQHQELSPVSSVMRRPTNLDNYHQNHENHYSGSRQSSYQDNYNHQPADRDAVRASESQRVKTVILPKMLTMRKIKPLHEMIGKSLMNPISTLRMA